MQFLKRLRPSNLIIAAALPFIVYLFVTSGDYQRSLRAIVGVENGSSVFVPGFIALALAFAAGLGVVLFSRAKARKDRWAMACAGLNLAVAFAVAVTGIAYPYIASIVANGVDPFTSDLVVKGVTPRRLTLPRCWCMATHPHFSGSISR
jgi:polar amino acid transport system permease protein